MLEKTGWREYYCRELMPTQAGKYEMVVLLSNLLRLKDGEEGKNIR